MAPHKRPRWRRSKFLKLSNGLVVCGRPPSINSAYSIYKLVCVRRRRHGRGTAERCLTQRACCATHAGGMGGCDTQSVRQSIGSRSAVRSALLFVLPLSEWNLNLHSGSARITPYFFFGRALILLASSNSRFLRVTCAFWCLSARASAITSLAPSVAATAIFTDLVTARSNASADMAAAERARLARFLSMPLDARVGVSSGFLETRRGPSTVGFLITLRWPVGCAPFAFV